MDYNFKKSLNDQREEVGFEKRKIKKTPFLKRVFLGLALFFLVGGLFLGFKTAKTINVISIKDKLFSSSSATLFEQKKSLYKDPDRINILLLGIRGENDPYGGLLADMLMLVSIKKDDGRVALISIPRDLYVEIPGHERRERINFAYAKGEEMEYDGGGLMLSKKVVSEATGVYIDYAVSVDFKAFEEVVDELGGIDIWVPADFREPTQWTYEFFIPKGWNHMDSETALYYVRSRFATSDFDRARRQQDMLLAIKNRALSLGVLANPTKIFSFLSILGKHVRTDMGMEDMKDLIKLASQKEIKVVKKKVLDTSPEGLLHVSYTENGAYILLPVGGNYDQINELVINIFEE